MYVFTVLNQICMNKFINLILLFSLLITSCIVGDKEKVEEKVPNKEPDNVEEVRTVIRNVYVSEDNFDMYDPYNGSLTQDTASYWYVYYTFNHDHSGFKVVKIDVPYFDVLRVQKAIKPTVADNDYLGIEFFERVTFECYMNFIRDRQN